MQFTKKLRQRIKTGEITTNIRIWKSPHVKQGGCYKLEQGHVVVTSIREISFDGISENLARESGFNALVDLIKSARHAVGRIVYFIRFRHVEG